MSYNPPKSEMKLELEGLCIYLYNRLCRGQSTYGKLISSSLRAHPFLSFTTYQHDILYCVKVFKGGPI